MLVESRAPPYPCPADVCTTVVKGTCATQARRGGSALGTPVRDALRQSKHRERRRALRVVVRDDVDVSLGETRIEGGSRDPLPSAVILVHESVEGIIQRLGRTVVA